MKKYIFLVITVFCTVTFSGAQSLQDTLVVVPGKTSMYFYHVVTKEETLYSLSRKYHVDPKELADFNHLTLTSRLQLFQIVKIPLNSENFYQSATANTTGLTPLYHKVLRGETLYHISQLHGKVPDALLKKWNGLHGNEVKTGEYLIIGWLKAGANGSAIAAVHQASAPAASSADTGLRSLSDTSPKTGSDGEMKENHSANKVAQSGNSPALDDKKSSSGSGSDNNSHNDAFLNEVIASENTNRHIRGDGRNADDNAFSVKLNASKTPATKKKAEEVNFSQEAVSGAQKRKPAKTEVSTTPSQPKEEEKLDSFGIMLNKVTHVSQQSASPKQLPSPSRTTQQDPDDKVGPSQNGGDQATVPGSAVTSVTSEFAQQYEEQTNEGTDISSKKGAAGWFKSNVKPGSGKYYALCNDLPRGTIVKVINPLNKKSILVKILDVIPKGAENYNLMIKISDAAMGDLGVAQSRFWCEIQYPKL